MTLERRLVRMYCNTPLDSIREFVSRLILRGLYGYQL